MEYEGSILEDKPAVVPRGKGRYDERDETSLRKVQGSWKDGSDGKSAW